MRILYIGQLWNGSTSLERMKILNALGHETVPFDVSAFADRASRVFQSLASRWNAGPIVSKLNRSLTQEARSLRAITHIWVDKGVWIYADTLQELKQMTGARAVHYTPDSQIFLHRSRHFMSTLPFYDVVITTKEWEVDAYKKSRAKRVLLTYQGYDARFHPRTGGCPKGKHFESDVCFIGHQEGHYANRIKAAALIDCKLRVWGPGWPRYARVNSWIQGIAGDGIWGEDYPLALASTKIALGLLSKQILETSTTRTFEIPAMGRFLLAERTSVHQQLFDEGKEAEFFSSDEEMVDKIRFYLRHDEVRQNIAAAGRARCERSGYSSIDLLRKILGTLVQEN